MFLPVLTLVVLFTRGLRAALLVSAAALPLRTVAPIVAGSANVLVEHICFSIMLGAMFYKGLLEHHSVRSMKVELETFLLSILCGYAIISAIIFPRLFNGLMVFSVSNTGRGGVSYANNLRGAFIYELAPTSGNLSQTAFLIFSVVVFILLLSFGRRYGYQLLHRIVCVAAIVHIGLGVADILGLDSILSMLRTASYKINDTHNIMGFDRTIGMMSEASRYGIFGGAIFAYFFAFWLIQGGRNEGRLAALALLTTLSSLSTSAFVSLGGSLMVLAIRFLLKRRLRRGSARRTAVLAGTGFLGIFILLGFTPVGGFILSAVDTLVLNKAASESGLIRAATSRQSLITLKETWYLGAGSGSVVSNGLLLVWLGNIGLPGAALFLAIFWLFMRGGARLRSQSPEAYAHWFAATTSVATLFVSEGISRTLLDPGLSIMLYGALAVSARRPLIVSFSSFRHGSSVTGSLAPPSR
jgi:hypothetical protein